MKKILLSGSALAGFASLATLALAFVANPDWLESPGIDYDTTTGRLKPPP